MFIFVLIVFIVFGMFIFTFLFIETEGKKKQRNIVKIIIVIYVVAAIWITAICPDYTPSSTKHNNDNFNFDIHIDTRSKYQKFLDSEHTCSVCGWTGYAGQMKTTVVKISIGSEGIVYYCPVCGAFIDKFPDNW